MVPDVVDAAGDFRPDGLAGSHSSACLLLPGDSPPVGRGPLDTGQPGRLSHFAVRPSTPFFEIFIPLILHNLLCSDDCD